MKIVIYNRSIKREEVQQMKIVVHMIVAVLLIIVQLKIIARTVDMFSSVENIPLDSS